MPASRSVGQSVYWPQQFAPNLIETSVMADDLLDVHPDDYPLLAGVSIRIALVAARQRADPLLAALEVSVELDRAAHRDPRELILEEEADARVGLELAVLETPDHGVHDDDIRLIGIEVEP